MLKVKALKNELFQHQLPSLCTNGNIETLLVKRDHTYMRAVTFVNGAFLNLNFLYKIQKSNSAKIRKHGDVLLDELTCRKLY